MGRQLVSTTTAPQRRQDPTATHQSAVLSLQVTQVLESRLSHFLGSESDESRADRIGDGFHEFLRQLSLRPKCLFPIVGQAIAFVATATATTESSEQTQEIGTDLTGFSILAHVLVTVADGVHDVHVFTIKCAQLFDVVNQLHAVYHDVRELFGQEVDEDFLFGLRFGDPADEQSPTSDSLFRSFDRAGKMPHQVDTKWQQQNREDGVNPQQR